MKKLIICLFASLILINCSTYMGKVSKGNLTLYNGEIIPFEGHLFFEENGNVCIFSNNKYEFYENRKIHEIHLIK